MLRIYLQETFVIEDYVRYNSLTTNDGIWSSSSAVVSYSSNGMYISNGNWSPFCLLDELSQDVSIEFDIVAMTITAGTGLYTCLAYDTDQTHNYGQTTLNSDGHYKLIIENDVLTVYKDNTQLETHNWAYSSFYWFLWTGGTRKLTLKDLKVKAL